MKQIYLDNAAATPIDPKVIKETDRAREIYGNPSSFNNIGRLADGELTGARLRVARFLGAHKEEIIFTSSGSEANNLAVWGTAFGNIGESRREIVTTPIEHPSLLEPLKMLAYEGFKSQFVGVNGEGTVYSKDLEKKITKNTLLVSVMYANNEIGTIEPVVKIGKMISDFRNKNGTNFPLFHIDACQATEYLDMNVNRLRADLVSFNGSKIYGPRGVGILYVRRGVRLFPIIVGGGQEQGLRAGTENLPAIVGLAKAVSLIDKKKPIRLTKLRDYFLSKITVMIPDARINGALGRNRLPNNINISIPGVDSENLLLELDRYGIYAGSGSACTSHSIEPSHVLKAIGVPAKYLGGVLRFSLGRQTTQKDIDYVLKILTKVVSDLKKRYEK